MKSVVIRPSLAVHKAALGCFSVLFGVLLTLGLIVCALDPKEALGPLLMNAFAFVPYFLIILGIFWCHRRTRVIVTEEYISFVPTYGRKKTILFRDLLRAEIIQEYDHKELKVRLFNNGEPLGGFYLVIVGRYMHEVIKLNISSYENNDLGFIMFMLREFGQKKIKVQKWAVGYAYLTESTYDLEHRRRLARGADI